MHDYLIIALIVLQAVDAYMTTYGLRNKTATELNPLLAKIIAKIGRDRAVIGAKLVAIAALLYFQNAMPVPVLAGLCVVYALVTANNARIIFQAGK